MGCKRRRFRPRTVDLRGGPLTANPRWSPDGRNVLFDSLMDGRRRLYLMSPEGGAPRRLTNGPDEEWEARWSRNGKWIYFVSSRTGRREVWKIPSDEGSPVQVTKSGGTAAFESADGTTLYYAKDIFFTGIWKVPIEGGEETKVLDGLSFSFNFVVVKDGLYFVSASSWPAPGVLKFYSFATGVLKPVLTIKQWSIGLTVSPDERSVLYTQLDQSGSDLMLVENFR